MLYRSMRFERYTNLARQTYDAVLAVDAAIWTGQHYGTVFGRTYLPVTNNGRA